MRRRNLRAFEHPEAPATADTPRRSMSRITLSLPTPVAEALRTASIREAVGYRAVILDAVEAFGSEVRTSTMFPPGRTQVPLNLPSDDLLVVDRAAHRSGANRSAFVTECLQRHLGLPDPR